MSEYLDSKSVAALTAKAETQLNFSSSSPQFSETNRFQDGLNHFIKLKWMDTSMQCCCEEDRNDLFSMSPAHRTRIRLEMHLRTIPLVIRLNSFRLINFLKDECVSVEIQELLSKTSVRTGLGRGYPDNLQRFPAALFSMKAVSTHTYHSTALKENVPTKVGAVLPREGTEKQSLHEI